MKTAFSKFSDLARHSEAMKKKRWDTLTEQSEVCSNSIQKRAQECVSRVPGNVCIMLPNLCHNDPRDESKDTLDENTYPRLHIRELKEYPRPLSKRERIKLYRARLLGRQTDHSY